MSIVYPVTGRNKTHLLNYYTTVFINNFLFFSTFFFIYTDGGVYCSPFGTQSTLQKLRGALQLNYFFKNGKKNYY